MRAYCWVKWEVKEGKAEGEGGVGSVGAVVGTRVGSLGAEVGSEVGTRHERAWNEL